MSEQAIGIGASHAAAQRSVRRIQPSTGIAPVDFGELWRYRELLWNFLLRDLRARYKQTFLGPMWAILRPVLSMVLFSAVFGGLAGFDKKTSVPYPLFLYAGMLPWNYFTSSLTGASMSLVNNSSLMAKTYFPRLYAPLAAAAAPLVDIVIALSIIFGLFGYYHRWPSWHMIFLPLFFLLAGLSALGVGLWLSGLTVRYRDVVFTLPFAIQLLMYTTPVLYPSSVIPASFRWILALNPITAVVDGTRWSLLGVSPPDVTVLAGSSALALVLLVTGLYYFRQTERTIVDLL